MATKAVIPLSLDVEIIQAVESRAEESGISRSRIVNDLLAGLLTKGSR